MVNLCGAILEWQSYILEKTKDIPVEQKPHAKIDFEFANLSFEPRRPKNQNHRY